MSYYPKGRHAGDNVDDFDEYDSTPYGGGYDISVTYGHSLPPSENICYRNTSSASDNSFDYNRPQFTSAAQPSAYGDEALANEYSSYTRPKSRPGSGSGGHTYSRPSGESGYGKPKPSYGGGEYGSGHGSPGSEYQSSEYGRKPEQGYRRKNDYDDPSSEYGSGHGRKSGSEHDSGYGRRNESEEYGSGHGRKSEFEEYGSGHGKKKSGYGDDSGGVYGGGRSEHERPTYGGRTNYGRSEDREGYDRPKYGSSEDDDHRKASYERRHHNDHDDDDDDDEKRHGHGYGHKKYVSILPTSTSSFPTLFARYGYIVMAY